MSSWTAVSIDFEQSHLVFPTIIAIIVALLGLAILIRDRRQILQARKSWAALFGSMDKIRFVGTLALTLIYFGLMVPVGSIWPNTGMGFLICSIPYVFCIGVLYLHDRTLKAALPIAVLSATAPPLTWWLFS